MAVNPVINISISQGADFSETFVSTEANGSISNLAGFTGASSMRKHPSASKSTNFSVAIIASTGEVSIALASTLTAALKPGRYVYDVRLISPGGGVSRLVEGQVNVTAGITTG